MSDRSPLERDDIQARLDRSPFIGFLRLRVTDVDHRTGRLSIRMPWRDEFDRGARAGQFHGGVIASLVDIVGDFAVGMMVGGGVPTMNLRVDYLRPGAGKHLDSTAIVRRLGRSTAVVDVDVTDPDGRIVALGRGTWVPVVA